MRRDGRANREGSKPRNTLPRKKKVYDLRSLARAQTGMGIRVLTGIAKNSLSDAARVSAVNILFDRGFGKPRQDVSVDNEIKITIRNMLVDDDEAAMIDVTPKT